MLKKYLFKYKFSLFIAILFITLDSIIGASQSIILKLITDSAANRDINLLKQALLSAILYIIINAVNTFLTHISQAAFIKKINISLRNHIF